MKVLFKKIFVESKISSVIDSYSYEGPSNLKSKQKIIPRGIRKLESEDIQYELVVEDKYGKKYKYVKDKVEPEVIEEGMQGDKPYGTTPITDVDDSKMTLTNLILKLLKQREFAYIR